VLPCPAPSRDPRQRWPQAPATPSRPLKGKASDMLGPTGSHSGSGSGRVELLRLREGNKHRI